MDQIPNDGLVNTNVFGDGQHLFDDALFPAGSDQAFTDASWGLHASAYHQPGSRAASTHNAPSWPQPASHVSTSNTPTNFHGQSNVYGRSPLHSPASFAQNNNYAAFGNHNFNNFNQQQAYPQHIQQHNINPAFQQQQQQQLQQHPQQQVQPIQQQQTQQYNIASSSTAAASPQNVPPIEQRQAPVQHERPQVTFNPPALPQKQASVPVAQSPSAADQNSLMQSIPASEQNGRFSTIDFSTLVKATNSERLTMFANMGRQPADFPVNRSTALPAYTKRHSRNELKRQAKDNPKLLAKLGAKAALNDRSSNASSRLTNAASPAQSVHSNDGIKYESDSDSDSDSDVSLYSDEEDDLAGAPLPSKRPDESAKGAVEYDTIKALWRNKRKTIDASSIRKGLGDFWEVAKTIRDRWKADTQAVQDAEAKKRVGDLALLKGRVKDQRDMLETAFRTALKHGFRGIIELFSENQSFLYLCYQFLLDRFKAEDINGSVSRLILEILSYTTSITEDKLDKTFLGKILPRYVKGGDAKTKYYAKKVVEAAAANSKGKPTKPAAAEPSAGVKRSSTAAGNAAPAAPAKKAAVGTATTNGNNAASRTLASVKKPADSTKPTATGPPVAATKTKIVQAKPSGFFNGLQSVGKKPSTATSDKATVKPAVQRAAAAPAKPAFNLAAELANLAKPKEEPKKPEPKPDTARDTESPERKAKRAARLARGAAGVRWKEAHDLVEVRYFSHDPAEELDHDASQMRDVKDVGGEGRMLKQHADMMDVDEEEDSAEGDSAKFVAFNTPSEVDFSTIDQEERDRLYIPYGGGKLQPDSAERATREQYERDNLIVIYSSPSDIPPNPREPTDLFNGDQGGPLREFGVPPEKFAARAHQRNAKRTARMPVPGAPVQTPAGPVPAFDIAAFSQFMAASNVPLPTQAQQSPAPLPVQQQQQPAAQFDFAAIMKQLQPQAAAPSLQPQAQQPSYNFQQPNYTQQQQPTASRPNGEPDISAILAALSTNNATQAASAPAPPAFQFPANFPMPFAAPAEQYQQQPAQQPAQQQQQQQQAAGNGNVKEKQNPWYKTKACKYYQEGKCKKGESCSYLHE